MVERLEHIIKNEADREEWENLLQRSGIRQEPPYDAIYGIYDDGRLVATGAREGNRLKCIAIDNAYQGGTLFNSLLSRMIRDASGSGIERLFVYTKPAAVIAFEYFGFRRIVDVPGTASFLERGTPTFNDVIQRWCDETDVFKNHQSNYNDNIERSRRDSNAKAYERTQCLNDIKLKPYSRNEKMYDLVRSFDDIDLKSRNGETKESDPMHFLDSSDLNSQGERHDVTFPLSLPVLSPCKKVEDEDTVVESIVMNANPFTLGHRALVENALTRASFVHLFVLSEDVSLFPAHIRLRLVREGTSDLPGVIIHTTDAYMISRASFPSYFLKKKTDATSVQAELDATLFRDRIAPALGITNRTVGDEPTDPVTAIYNKTLISTLEGKINLTIVPRIKTHEGETISASRVRELFLEGDLAGLRPYVPETTYRYLISPEGQTLIS